ncbi:MAG: hypothetical protein H6Q90_1195 [Deltaproteobacteria bacterium]|nr:hypothetical protein [Deltaproteobacteria bacterium]
MNRELGGFVRYCVRRIETELGEREHWMIRIGIGRPGYKTQVVLEHFGLVLDAAGCGHDPTLAVWDAMGRIEQMLRDRRGLVSCVEPKPPGA